MSYGSRLIHPSLFFHLAHFDDGEKSMSKPYGFALLAGIDRYPLKVTKSMSAKKVDRRSRVKPFLRAVNYSHLMPTRYTLDAEVKNASVEVLRDPIKKKDALKSIRKVFLDKYSSYRISFFRYKTGKDKWFFQKLRY